MKALLLLFELFSLIYSDVQTCYAILNKTLLLRVFVRSTNKWFASLS